MSVQSVVKCIGNMAVLGTALAMTLNAVSFEASLVASSIDESTNPCQFSSPCPTTTGAGVEDSVMEQA
ncbi:MAG: hypothetical protein F6K16_30595 [Symploca sp. SIO2B6]|nr:hypothetical protein [Symploca sp. SIO2B6]